MTLKKSLHSLLNDVFVFAKSDFHLASYLYTLLFVFATIFLNYYTGFYANFMRESYFNGKSLWMFPLFYAVVYYAVAIPVLVLRKDVKTIQNPKFYLKSLFFIVLYGIGIGFFSYRNWEFPSLFYDEKLFVMRLLSQLKGAAFFILPLYFFKVIFDKNVKGLYGLAANAKHIKGYLMLFLMLSPFLIAMSFTPDFMKAYPQFRAWLYDGIFGFPT